MGNPAATSSRRASSDHAGSSSSSSTAQPSTTEGNGTPPPPPPITTTGTAEAGPPSPSRRRRGRSSSRRRSSSISAATSLLSAYSTPDRRGSTTSSRGHQRSSQGQGDDDDDDDDVDYSSDMSESGFATGASQVLSGARDAFRHGRPSPYHMAVVMLFGTFAQGLPLASMFKEYSFLMCKVHAQRTGRQSEVPPFAMSIEPLGMLESLLAVTTTSLPSAPQLPSPPICSEPWVRKATSTYAAAMATVGALLALVLLDGCSKLSRRFGRKPLMLVTHLLLTFAFLGFRLAVSLPIYLGVSLLFLAVVIYEASAGAPLKIAQQNYVVDTTSEAQRAGALSFTEGFGQLGAFPSSTFGGWLSAVTGKFFAPFYATVASYAAGFAYILVLVPESKKHHRHTFIDDWEHTGAGDEEEGDDDDDYDDDDGQRRGSSSRLRRGQSYVSSAASEAPEEPESPLGRFLSKFNFLSPLSIFLPTRQRLCIARSGERPPCTSELDLRLLNLALIVVAEETFQVFFVPQLLLYNGEVFGFDVVQNGYLVSLLQGVRAVWLTFLFPPVVARLRRWVTKRADEMSSEEEEEGRGAEPDERDGLLQDGDDDEGEEDDRGRAEDRARPGGHSTSNGAARPRDGNGSSRRPLSSKAKPGKNDATTEEARHEERGKLDFALLLGSYTLATVAFLLIALSKRLSSSPWVGLASSIVLLQISSGSTSLRTALIVNAVDDSAESASASAKARGQSQSHNQTKALAANQILATIVLAVVPILTSSVYGAGLGIGRPELVWYFKAGWAALAALGSAGLFWTHRYERFFRSCN